MLMSPDAIREIIDRLDRMHDEQVKQATKLDEIASQVTETNGRVRRLEAWREKVDSWRHRIGDMLSKLSDGVRQLELWRAELRGAWTATAAMGGKMWVFSTAILSASMSGVAVFLITRALS